MPKFTDQLGNTIILNRTPQRIVSAVPSQTELLFDLGLEEQVIGITKFCVRPDRWYRNKPRIGGTKSLNLQLIEQLKPDLIIANKEENRQAQIVELQGKFPVWISDVRNLEEALMMIGMVGEMVGKDATAKELITEIQKKFDRLTENAGTAIPKTAYLIWSEPYMTVGGDTFIHDMMKQCRFKNIFSSVDRYPKTTTRELAQKGCELLMLSSEPFPFAEKHRAALSAQLPNAKVLLVDGEIFSWYGSRMLQAPAYFQQLRQLIGK